MDAHVYPTGHQEAARGSGLQGKNPWHKSPRRGTWVPGAACLPQSGRDFGGGDTPARGRHDLRGRETVPMYRFTLRTPQWSAAGPVQSQELGTQCRHLWAAGAQVLGHCLLPSRVGITWKLGLGVGLGLEPRYSVDIPTTRPKARPTSPRLRFGLWVGCDDVMGRAPRLDSGGFVRRGMGPGGHTCAPHPSARDAKATASCGHLTLDLMRGAPKQTP